MKIPMNKPTNLLIQEYLNTTIVNNKSFSGVDFLIPLDRLKLSMDNFAKLIQSSVHYI